MPDDSSLVLSVSALFVEREARRRREQEAEEQLKQREREELAAFRQRLEDFQLSDDRIHAVLDRIRRAFDRGETELLLTSFPSSFCSDQGRAIGNADLPPINKPDPSKTEADPKPAWIMTLPGGAHVVYDYWKSNLKPGGFQFSARIINFKDGRPGDVGLFLSWPRSMLDA